MITPSNNAIGKALLEIGKALGKAIVAGVGLELARAATGHVKRIVGPKDDDDEAPPRPKKKTDAKKTDAKKTDAKHADVSVDAIDPEEVARIRKENEALRAELAALKSSPSAE